MNKKDYNNAIAAFKQAAAMKGSPVADRATYEAARAYEVSGDKPSAIERYDYLIKTFPNSPWSQDASAKLSKVKGVPATPQEQQQNKTETKGTNNQ
jgi:outer membrane protein assembly factor BamD (BamD/ComL family)